VVTISDNDFSKNDQRIREVFRTVEGLVQGQFRPFSSVLSTAPNSENPMNKILTLALVVSAAAFAAEVKTPAAPAPVAPAAVVATPAAVDTAKKAVVDTTKAVVDSAKAVVAPAAEPAKAAKPTKSKK
jgi:hypothetical protein